MTIRQICDEPIEQLTADDAHLHLWTTNAFLFDAYKVMEAWGFQRRSCFVWAKQQMGLGNYWRVSHEFLLLGIRGNAKRFRRRDLKSWRVLDCTKHSRKPPEVRKMIEEVSPGPFLECYAREFIDGWTVYDNESEATPTTSPIRNARSKNTNKEVKTNDRPHEKTAGTDV